LVSGLVVAVLLAFFALFQWRSAEKARTLAQQAQSEAAAERDQIQLSLSSQMAALSEANLPNQLDLALLFGIMASETASTFDGRNSLLKALETNPRLVTFFRAQAGGLTSLAFSPDGKIIAAGGIDGTIRLWNTANRSPIGLPLPSHKGKVLHLAFSPDGKKLASAGSDHKIVIWYLPDNLDKKGLPEKISAQVFSRHADWVRSLDFSPDGRILASCSDDRTIRLWDLTTNRLIDPPLTGHSAAVLSVAFSPDGKYLVSGSADKTIRLWDITYWRQKSLAATHTITALPAEAQIRVLFGHTDWIRSVAFDPTGTRIASGSDDHSIRLWETATGDQIHSPFFGHTNSVLNVKFSPDGQLIASSSSDRTVILWDVATGKPRGLTRERIPVSIESAPFSRETSPDQPELSGDPHYTLRDMATGQPLDSLLTGHTGIVHEVAFSPDGHLLASASEDDSVILWDASERPISNLSLGTLSGRTIRVSSLAFSPDGKLLAAGGSDRINVWDFEFLDTALNKVIEEPLPWPALNSYDWIRSLVFHPSGQILAAGVGAQIYLWDVVSDPASGRPSAEPINPPLSGHVKPITSLAFNPSATNILASGSLDRTIILWDITTAQSLTGALVGHTDSVNSLAFSPDGSRLASGSSDRTVRLWQIPKGIEQADLHTRLPVDILAGHSAGVNSVVFSPDGQWLASGSDDQTIIIWDVASGRPKHAPLRGHTDIVTSLAFSPDGFMLASASNDNTIILWDVATGRQMGPALYGHTSNVFTLAFSPNGRVLVSGGSGRYVYLWNTDLTLQQARACQRANRNLTTSEWQRYFSNEPYRLVCPSSGKKSSR
jgi:WD40 repeat protein